MAHILAVVIAVLGLLTSDLTGTWKGTLTPDGSEARPAHLVLRQDGRTVSGTAGASEDEERHPIRNGTINDDVVTFDVDTNDGVLKCDLRLKDDQLTGTVSRVKDGQSQTATLLVTRTK